MSAGAELTTREAEVIRLVGRGWNNGEIAAWLGVSPYTVKTHLGRASARLEIYGRAGLVGALHSGVRVRPPMQPAPLPASWEEPAARFREHLQAAGTSAGSLRLRRHFLKLLAQHAGVGPWECTPALLVAFMASRPDWSPETRHSARSAICSFYRWAEDTGRVDLDPARRLPSVRVPAGLPRPAPEAVVTAALQAADPRARVMVMLAAYAGLRCGEIARVHSRDITEEGLRVRGKGGKTRAIPLIPVLLEALATRPPGWAFAGGVDGHLSAAHVGLILKRLLGEGWSAHTLRHRFASRAYAGTRDLRAVQTLLGHSKPETTARYTLVPEQSLIEAVRAAL